MAWEAFSLLVKPGQQHLLAGKAASRLDGRPSQLLALGGVCHNLHHADLAAHWYGEALRHAPDMTNWLRDYVNIMGTAEPLEMALYHRPKDLRLLNAAADYYADKPGLPSRKRAEALYRGALELDPTNAWTVMDVGKQMRLQGRGQEVIAFYEDWLARHDRGDFECSLVRASIAKNLLALGKAQESLAIVDPMVSGQQAGVMCIAAEAHEKLGNLPRAQQIYGLAIKRYPSSDFLYAGLASLHWRGGQDVDAAKVVARGRVRMGEQANWYAQDFAKTVGGRDLAGIRAAVSALMQDGCGAWELLRLARQFYSEGNPKAAMMIMDMCPREPGAGGLLLLAEHYGLARLCEGEAAAHALLGRVSPGQETEIFACALYLQGHNEAILELTSNLDAVGPGADFLWLMRVMAWLANNKEPAELGAGIGACFASPKPSHYHAAGRFLLGLLSQDELLAMATDNKKRCELAYYVGLFHRLRGNYAEASDWYAVAQATGQERNGEYRWAYEELLQWTDLGLVNRHRFLVDDLEERLRLDSLGE